VSGLVLSALAIVVTSSGGSGSAGQVPEQNGGTQPGVLRAQMGAGPVTTTPSTTTATSVAAVLDSR
jgi:hypothetical protein